MLLDIRCEWASKKKHFQYSWTLRKSDLCSWKLEWIAMRPYSDSSNRVLNVFHALIFFELLWKIQISFNCNINCYTWVIDDDHDRCWHGDRDRGNTFFYKFVKSTLQTAEFGMLCRKKIHWNSYTSRQYGSVIPHQIHQSQAGKQTGMGHLLPT